MTSEIKVDTISEQTSANGVTIDGLTIKDGNIIGDVALAGTTPTFTIGDGGAEDAALIFDGNAVDFVVGLDDSADEFRIGVGSGLGSDRVFEINSSGDTTFQKPVFFAGSSPSVTIGDGGAEDTKLVFDGNAQDFYIALDDSADDLVIGTGSTVGSNVKMVVENGGNVGIGTSSPGELVEVNGGNLKITDDDNVYLSIDSTQTNGDEWHIFNAVSGTSSTLQFKNIDQSAVVMLLDESGKIGIGTTSPEDMLHVLGSGSTAVDIGTDASAEVVAQFIPDSTNSRNGRLKIAGTNIPSNNSVALISDASSNVGFSFNVKGSSIAEAMIIDHDAKIATNGETAPDVGNGGLCLQQGANDGLALSFKSSDVAHGITSGAETDTYFKIAKNSAASGGVDLFAYSERTDGEYMRIGLHGNGISDTKSTSGVGALHMFIGNKSGTNIAGLGTNDNMITIAAYTNTRFIFDAEGDFHADSSSTTFDAYDDAQLVRAYDLSHGKGVINSKFDKFIEYNHEKLANLKLVGREEDGTPNNMVSVTGMQRLHNGAIWQQYEKHQKLASAFYKLAEKTIGKEEADKLLTEEEIQLLN